MLAEKLHVQIVTPQAGSPRTEVRGSPGKNRRSSTGGPAGGFSPRSEKSGTRSSDFSAPHSASSRLRLAESRTIAVLGTARRFPLAALALLFVLCLGTAGGCTPAGGHSAGASAAADQNSQAKLTIAAAASLAGVLPEIKERFVAQNPDVQVEIVFGSSGAFFAQLQNRAPFDLFLSADTLYPQKLVEKGVALPEDYREYARGQVVLWVTKDSPLKVEQGLQVLAQKSVRRISLANPATAPYGKAAVEALKHHKLYEQVESKLARGENVAHAAQMVQSGAADCGMIALSLAVSPRLRDQGRWYVVPPDSYRPIRQGLVVLRESKQRELARRFVQFLFTPQARELFAKYGFSDPEPAR